MSDDSINIIINLVDSLQVSKWGDKVAGLVVVEPGISTASFLEWGEGKVSMALGDKLVLWSTFNRIFLQRIKLF